MIGITFLMIALLHITPAIAGMYIPVGNSELCQFVKNECASHSYESGTCFELWKTEKPLTTMSKLDFDMKKLECLTEVKLALITKWLVKNRNYQKYVFDCSVDFDNIGDHPVCYLYPENCSFYFHALKQSCESVSVPFFSFGFGSLVVLFIVMLITLVTRR